jgi:uncharacterized protein YeaO (DUF488 family)
MHEITIKRIYEAPSIDDGYRILVDRLWPRSIKKEDAYLEEWNKELAPSSELRKWFDHKNERFAEFSERYHKELLNRKEELKRIRTMAKTKSVTLLYAARDRNTNHAVVLCNVLKNTDQ